MSTRFGLPRPPNARPHTPVEVAFLAWRESAYRRLVEAAGTGVVRIRATMARAADRGP